jgi:type IV pilus assembly protein PilE
MKPASIARTGFTLVELMVCLAVSAILVAAAVPGYRSSVQKVRRADAREALLRIQVLQERHYFEQGRYAANLRELNYPTEVTLSREGHYRLQILAGQNGSSYVARATAISASQQDDATCRTLLLDPSGTLALSCGP